jgi:hypothetical protein
MAGSVVRTGSEPEPDPMEPNPVVRFQVRPTPPNLTPVQFGVLSFQSKNRTEPDYGNTNSEGKRPQPMADIIIHYFILGFWPCIVYDHDTSAKLLVHNNELEVPMP